MEASFDLNERQTLTVVEVANILGIGRTTAYWQIKNGTFPLPLIEGVSPARISRRSLERFLHSASNEALSGELPAA